ncbi:hypothetical protein N9087_00785 [bacterium]|nr:hypothetical protein [bacterium]
MVIIERCGMARIRLMNEEVLDYLTNVVTEEGVVTFVSNPDMTVTTAGATKLAYNPRLIDVRFEQGIETDPDAGRCLRSHDQMTTRSVSPACGQAIRSASNWNG